VIRIFISYSRRDKAVADYIGAELRNRGADVFIDYQKLIGGENFIRRLGREIEACNVFVLLLSPCSVASKWVQAEAAWALRCDKPIIPVLLEPASMADFFFLTNVEQVDFTRWSVDGQVGEAVHKLAAALGLPAERVRAEPVPEPLIQTVSSEEEEAEEKLEATSAPAFARGDLSELFLTAAEVANEDPEQAIFLYRRILEIDPEYMQGRARDFVQREEERLKSARLAHMRTQAEAAMKAGEWNRGERIGRDMLALDENNANAKRIVDICTKNAECEPIYKQAVLAAQAGRWEAVATLMRDIRESCPDYGNPAGLLREVPISKAIQAELTAYLCGLTTLTCHGLGLSVAFSPDGSLLASGSLVDGGMINLWEMPVGRYLPRFMGHTGSVHSVTFSPDGSLLASGSSDQTIKLWKIPSGRELATLTGHSKSVLSVAFSPDGSLLASGSISWTIKLLEMPSGRELATLTGHKGAVHSVTFSPDGSLLASASSDQTIKLWEMLGGRKLATLTGHNGAVHSVAFSPDGSLLASASSDQTIKLWEMPGGRELTTLKGHREPVHCVTFSPNGSLLASASADWTIKLWGLG